MQVTGYSNAEEAASGKSDDVSFSIEDKIAAVSMHDFFVTEVSPYLSPPMAPKKLLPGLR